METWRATQQYDKWPIVYEDSEVDIRRDSQSPEDYGLQNKKNEQLVFFPRDSLKEIALSRRSEGNQIIQNLLGIVMNAESFFNGTNLTLDSLNATICKAYISEETRRQNL